MKTRALAVLSTLILAVLAPTLSLGVAPDRHSGAPGAGEGEILVKFRPGTAVVEMDRVHARSAAAVKHRYRRTRWQAVSLPSGADPREALRRYRRSASVEAAEYVQPRRIAAIPNDLQVEQWGFRNTGQPLRMCADYSQGDWIPCGSGVADMYVSTLEDADIDADLAWDLSIGSTTVVVAVLDTGIDHSREDLSLRLVGGHDFIENDSYASDDHGHGTAVASVIGAIGNNGVGITGLNWNVRLMPIKVCDRLGECPDSAVLAGIEHAVDNGADVINMSLGCDQHRDPNAYPPWEQCTSPEYRKSECVSEAERETIGAARDAGVVVVAAAGNCGGDNDDDNATYPCAHDIDGLICAGATDPEDNLSDFSNYGPLTVDVGAPGSLILAYRTTPPGGSYFVSGTSFATPMTAGAAALLLSRTPFTPEAVRDRIAGGGEPGVRPMTDLTNFFTGGRLNVYNTLQDVFLRRRIYSKERLGHVRLIADVTGDGRGDLVRGFDGAGFRVSRNSAKKRRFLDSELWTGVRPTSTVLAGDVNADGREELILGDASGFRVLIKRPLKPRFRAPEVWSTEPDGLLHATGDVDADGLADIVRFDGNFDVLLSTGASFQAPATWSGDTAGDSIAAADVDGDGRSDLVNWFNAGGATQVEISLSTGSGFAPSSLWFDGDEMEFHGADDFDADGLADLLGLDPSSGCLSVIRSTGTAFESPRVWSCPRIGTDAILTGRVGWNGDTRADIVIHFQGGRWRLFESAH